MPNNDIFNNDSDFAPVAITSLSRCDCLKTVIHSLENCSWAEKTDVYISIDFPPNEEYEHGYSEVCGYLAEMQETHRFKSLNCYFHKSNLGPFENYLWLVRLVLAKHEKIILLEDDNEVAPCFLDFCNKALDIYKDSTEVVAVNPSDYVWCGGGFTPPLRTIAADEANVEKRQMLWHATAFWGDDILPYYTFVANQGLLAIGDNPSALLKLFRRCKLLCYQYLRDAYNGRSRAPWSNGRFYSIDMAWDVAMIVFDKVAICPIESLQRDLGVMGNGNSFTTAFSNGDELRTRSLKKEPIFDFVNTPSATLNAREFELHDTKQHIRAWRWVLTVLGYCARLIQRKVTGSCKQLRNPWSKNADR